VPNLALIALGDSHHSQGGMKFATQISPLLNCKINYIKEIFCYQLSFVTIVFSQYFTFNEENKYGRNSRLHSIL
jgi:hypothetical protein